MQLAGNLILVKPDQQEEKTSSGIYIPDSAKKKDNRGTVILVGPGFPDEPMLVQPGEHILYQPNAGLKETYEGEEHLIMRQSDRLAILK